MERGAWSLKHTPSLSETNQTMKIIVLEKSSSRARALTKIKRTISLSFDGFHTVPDCFDADRATPLCGSLDVRVETSRTETVRVGSRSTARSSRMRTSSSPTLARACAQSNSIFKYVQWAEGDVIRRPARPESFWVCYFNGFPPPKIVTSV